MKIKVVQKPFEEVMKLPRPKHVDPRSSPFILRGLLKLLLQADLKATDFGYTKVDMEKWRGEPALILMNHSCFLDLSIASSLLYPEPFTIVCTSDGFVGKEWLMRLMGCIPTQKFVSDMTLVKDMIHSLRKLKSSVLLYPEASYSFDGTGDSPAGKPGQVPQALEGARDPHHDQGRLRSGPALQRPTAAQG